MYLKAEALYYMGEFEFALVFYHRGHKLRPQMQEFRLGIQKAQEAIENSVGSKWQLIVLQSSHISLSYLKYELLVLCHLLGPSNVKLEIKGDLSFLNIGGEVSLWCIYLQ